MSTVETTKEDCEEFLVTVTRTMSNEPTLKQDTSLKHLTLEDAMTLTAPSSNVSSAKSTPTKNGNNALLSIEYSYNYDYGQLQMNTPSTSNNTNNINISNLSGSAYDSITIPSNLDITTPSASHTDKVPSFDRSLSAHTPAYSVSHSAANSESVSSKKKKKKADSPGHKFATEFFKKGKVKSVLRNSTIIGQFEAKMMLAYFRNIEVENIDSSDIALRYLESKSVRHLKRNLREMNETIRRAFMYGSDYTHIHEQHLLGNDTNNDQLLTITENQVIQQNGTDFMTTPNVNDGTYVNLGDLTNNSTSMSSLDEYLQSPNTTYTPYTAIGTHSVLASETDLGHNNHGDMDNKEEIIFDPLKGAQNVVVKSSKLNFKKNFAKSYQTAAQHIQQTKLPSPPQSPPQYDSSNDLQLGAKSPSTRFYGKYFDKRGSNISHGSIWSESDSDPNDNASDSEDPYVLTQFSSDSEGDDEDENASDIDHDGVGLPDKVSQVSLKSMNSLEVPASHKGPPPGKSGKEHISHWSFASTVSLGSLASDHQSVSDDECTKSPKLGSNGSGNGKKRKKTLKKRRFGKDGKELKDKSKCRVKIDSLLLHNQPPVKHSMNYSLDSFLSDFSIPEPTAVEKLKYHLTEPRQPPSRRATYNYSHV